MLWLMLVMTLCVPLSVFDRKGAKRPNPGFLDLGLEPLPPDAEDESLPATTYDKPITYQPSWERHRQEIAQMLERQRAGVLPGLQLSDGLIWVTIQGSRTDPGRTEKHPVTAQTAAALHESGSVTAVRGRNLAAKGASTLLLGPAGLLLVGNAKTQVMDDRSWYLTIGDDTWHHGLMIPETLRVNALNFAERVNAAARAVQARGTAPAHDRVSELERLARLHQSGALTDEEFAASKQRVLEAVEGSAD